MNGININLLPWREAKREREKKEFIIYLVIGLVAALLVVFMINFYARQLIDHQNARNAILQKEITNLQIKINKIKKLKKIRAALIARMSIVKNLQSLRILTVRLFDKMVKITPNGVFFREVERRDNKITLYGYAESNANISQLMRNIEHEEWIQSPELTEIKRTNQKKSDASNEFKLNFVIGSEEGHQYVGS